MRFEKQLPNISNNYNSHNMTSSSTSTEDVSGEVAYYPNMQFGESF